ncbi:MAG: S49 family peptidase, partial [bacterium]
MRKSTIALIIVLVVLSYVIFGSILISWLIRSQPKLPSFSKNLALIEVEGIIADPRVVVRQIKKYSKNPAVAALVLRIDSPGGVVSATQEIYEEIKRAKEREKKIIVSMGSIAASGGYYIATPADIIVANPGSVTGSIGVKMELPILERL